MTDLFHRHAEMLAPLAKRLVAIVKASDIVLADETTIRMQGTLKRAYLWTFIADRTITYVFSKSRSGETPVEVLGGEKSPLERGPSTGTAARSRRLGSCSLLASSCFPGAAPSLPVPAGCPHATGMQPALPIPVAVAVVSRSSLWISQETRGCPRPPPRRARPRSGGFRRDTQQRFPRREALLLGAHEIVRIEGGELPCARCELTIQSTPVLGPEGKTVELVERYVRDPAWQQFDLGFDESAEAA